MYQRGRGIEKREIPSVTQEKHKRKKGRNISRGSVQKKKKGGSFRCVP